MKRLFLVVTAAFLFSGCATIFTGSSDTVTFNSVPQGGAVEINGAGVGRTPVTIPMQRSLTPPQVKIRMDGYEPQHMMLQNTFNTVAILDIFFWPGFIVDAATGSLMKYSILSYEAELHPKKP